jgi:hypothetical protein
MKKLQETYYANNKIFFYLVVLFMEYTLKLR